MARRRPLPLESPHWRPINAGLDHRSRQTGSHTLAAQDFNRVLRADRLRALVRREDGQRELLTASAWDDLYIDPWFTPPSEPLQQSGLAVFSRKLGLRPPGCWFFIWLPDYKNIFGDLDAQPGAPSSVQEVPEKRGRKPKHPWPEIGHELFRRIAKNGALTVPKSTKSLADELGDWCEVKYKKAPVDSELRKVIDDVLFALKLKRR